MSRSKTVTEEFDTEGHLLKRTVEEWSDEAEPAKTWPRATGGYINGFDNGYGARVFG